jgi:hypothetical protein
VTADADGDGWSSSLTSANTTTLAAGDHYWQAYATKDSRRETLGSGRLRIKPAAGSGVSGKSQDRQDLEAVQAAIRAIIDGGAVQEYTIAGRSLRKMEVQDLIALENRLRVRVYREEKREQLEQGLPNPSNIYVRFKK